MKINFTGNYTIPESTLRNAVRTLAMKKARLLELRSDDCKEDLSAYMADEFDFATIQSLQLMGIRLNDRKAKLIASIEKSLRRIQTGVFGNCESCDGAITPARLEAVPHAELCLGCKEEEELERSKSRAKPDGGGLRYE